MSIVCSGCSITSDTKLACPKCLQLGLPATFYCSQDCFTKNYDAHKRIHTIAKQQTAHRKNSTHDGVSCSPTEPIDVRLSLPRWAHSYIFTGSLRPCLMSPIRSVKPGIRKPDYASHPQGVSFDEQASRGAQIHVYSENELKAPDDPTGLRHACRMGREVLDEASRALRVSVTTDEIDRVVHDSCMERNVYPSPLNYYNFPKSIAPLVLTGPLVPDSNSHGIPDYREVQSGDIVNIDISVYNEGGYHADLNETFCVGDVEADRWGLVETSFRCLANAIDLVRPGCLYRDLGAVIEKTAKMNKCSVVRTYCGHGIGKLFHTIPNIPHYAKNKAKGTMQPGHVFTIEPMINLGNPGDITWDDNWTAVTRDGKCSSQFEHTLVVTKSGYEILTARDNEPVMTWNPELNSR